MENTDTDTVIGLNVRGKIFYCNRSKLLNVNNGHSYFSERFREDRHGRIVCSMQLECVDSRGRDIYKLDRDPSIFQYIMEYIRTDKKSIGIGLYEMNKKLWGLVREEAVYFGLDSLVHSSRITFSCSPEVDKGLGASGKGIMYWLGTNKNTLDYVNPYSSGAVEISGWFEGDKNSRISEEDKMLMVQYRPNPEGEKSKCYCDNFVCGNGTLDFIFQSSGAMMGCGHLRWKQNGPLNFHLLNGVVVSPTHYSIRNGGCYGMGGYWNLEASIDGKNWDVIHEARGKSRLYEGINRNNERSMLWDTVKHLKGDARRDVICEYMEQNYRHTWKVVNTSGKIYTHFRFMSVTVPYNVEVGLYKGDDRVRKICLHGIGFEVYGDVYEEWGDEYTHIQELENQNEEVLNENKKLKAQNDALLSSLRIYDELCKIRMTHSELLSDN